MNAPRQLTRQAFSNPSTDSSSSDARCSKPALLTSVVNDPNVPTVVATACCHSHCNVTSSGIADHRVIAQAVDRGGNSAGVDVAGRDREPIGA